jgi:hypothetical protein
MKVRHNILIRDSACDPSSHRVDTRQWSHVIVAKMRSLLQTGTSHKQRRAKWTFQILLRFRTVSKRVLSFCSIIDSFIAVDDGNFRVLEGDDDHMRKFRSCHTSYHQLLSYRIPLDAWVISIWVISTPCVKTHWSY